MFHSFLSSLAKCKYLPLFSFSLIFTKCSASTAMFTNTIIYSSFFTPALAGDFSLKFESPQFSRTLLSILADLNNVVWMVST